MFSFFKKSDSLKFTDRVWKTRQAMLQGMIGEALDSIQSSHLVIIISWFEDKNQSVIDFLTKNNIPNASDLSDNKVIHLMLADELMRATGLVQKSEKNKIAFFFDGHYPLLQKENDVLEKFKALNKENISVIFCQSLEIGLLKAFMGDKIAPLMEQLGMKEDECFEHPMISKSITNARTKLSREVTNEMTSRNEGEWFLKNVRR